MMECPAQLHANAVDRIVLCADETDFGKPQAR